MGMTIWGRQRSGHQFRMVRQQRTMAAQPLARFDCRREEVGSLVVDRAGAEDNWLLAIVCDNGGFSVIDKLQTSTGNEPFNNQFTTCRRLNPQSTLPCVDFAQHAASMGATSENVSTLDELESALQRAKDVETRYVIAIGVDEHTWSSVDNAWWHVGLAEVTDRDQVKQACANFSEGQTHQRRGV